MSTNDKFSAGEQSLGYTYQARFALLQLLRLPEETAVLIEKDDDLDFVDVAGLKSLASLKHKAAGERLTDLSIDFWKSINIWLTRYKRDGCAASCLRFFLFTTAAVSEKSFLSQLTASGERKTGDIVTLANEALAATTSTVILTIKADFDVLNDLEKKTSWRGSTSSIRARELRIFRPLLSTSTCGRSQQSSESICLKALKDGGMTLSFAY
jgi:hypothetical protein